MLITPEPAGLHSRCWMPAQRRVVRKQQLLERLRMLTRRSSQASAEKTEYEQKVNRELLAATEPLMPALPWISYHL
jgi:hypothetical protein